MMAGKIGHMWHGPATRATRSPARPSTTSWSRSGCRARTAGTTTPLGGPADRASARGHQLHRGTAARRRPAQPSGDADRARARGCDGGRRSVEVPALADTGRNRCMAEKLLSTSDTKLIQYLNEAYGKEKELETALQAHIEMTDAHALQEAPAGASEGDQGAGARASSAASRSSAARPRGQPAGPDAVDAAEGDRRGHQGASPRPRARCTRCAAPARPRSCSRTPRPSSGTSTRRSATTSRSRSSPKARRRQGDREARARAPQAGGADGALPRRS